MEWIKLPDDMHNGRTYLPLDRCFLALWKGSMCYAEYNEDEDCFFISMMPGYSDVMRVSRDRERKFTHFCILEMPKDF